MEGDEIMICPKCGGYDSRIVDSRHHMEKNVKYRRRECLECGTRYSTHEIPDEKIYELVESLIEIRLKKNISKELTQMVNNEIFKKRQ